MRRSGIYCGWIRHRRFAPKPHGFGYRFHMLYLDLEELPSLFEGRWLWSFGRSNLLSFRRSDYLGPEGQSLREAVLDRVEAALGRRPAGRLGILTQVRTMGYLFNPVSFYYSHDGEGNLDAIVAEITNTPWGERHAYVLDAKLGDQGAGRYVFEFDKGFHVSPFFPMGQTYCWEFTWQRNEVFVGMTNHEGGKCVFEASLVGHRQELTGRNMVAAILRYPLQPLRMQMAIYGHAARLYLKRTPFFTHPKKTTPLEGVESNDDSD